MALVQNTLATQLQNLAPASVEATAITNLVNAYATYAAGAAALTPILSTGIDLGKAAMQSALVGMSATGAGLVSIPAAIVAFWAAVAAGLTASFAGATAITPPPHATLAALFAATCAANTASELSLADSTAAIAANMHENAILGGTVTTAGPTVTPIL
jgi:hypothetical protein